MGGSQSTPNCTYNEVPGSYSSDSRTNTESRVYQLASGSGKCNMVSAYKPCSGTGNPVPNCQPNRYYKKWCDFVHNSHECFQYDEDMYDNSNFRCTCKNQDNLLYFLVLLVIVFFYILYNKK